MREWGGRRSTGNLKWTCCWAQSTMRKGLDLKIVTSWPELKPRLGGIIDWATQVPLLFRFLKLLDKLNSSTDTYPESYPISILFAEFGIYYVFRFHELTINISMTHFFFFCLFMELSYWDHKPSWDPNSLLSGYNI